MTKTLNFQYISFGHFVIRYCGLRLENSTNLFRISDFDIRILPEHDFSFRHYLPKMEPIKTNHIGFVLGSQGARTSFNFEIAPQHIEKL